MVNFLRATLVLFDVHVDSAKVAFHNFPWIAREKQDQFSETTIFLDTPSGWVGSRAGFNLNVPPPLFLGEAPRRVTIRTEQLGNFLVRQLFVELSVAQLSQLTVSARARHDENDAVAQFAASLMPSSEFERVFPRGSAQEYCSLLELWISAADAEPTADLAGRCRIQLGVDQNVLIPVEVDGVLVLPGILLGGPGYSLTTVRRQGDSNENLTMSGISFDLIALMVATPTIELLSSRIEKLPLAEGSPTSYVEKRMRNERTALGMYTGHLSDREQLLNAVLTANDDVLILSESVTERRLTRFLNAGRMREFPEIVDEQYPNVRGSYDPLSHLTMHFKEALLSYEQAKRRAEGRDQLIAEYLRDRVNAEIAVSNLKIQRTVSALTMFAIALAGLALAEGLLTDTAKTQVLQWLMKLFIH